MPLRFDALIVDKELSSRMNLRQTTAALPDFHHISMANSISSALDTLKMDQNCDIIIFKPNFSEKENADFIQRCKTTKNGNGCALILVLKPNQQNVGGIAKNFANGADGFLPEPYSVENLHSVFEIAGKLKKQKLEQRAKLAMEIVLKEATEIFDSVAYTSGGELDSAKRREFQKVGSNLRELAQTDFTSYEAMLISRFENIAPPPVTDPKYSGASERIRLKALKEIEKAKAAQPEVKKPVAQPRIYRR